MKRLESSLTPSTRWMLAVGCAISVGNLYYLQPLLAAVARDLKVAEHDAGFAATLSQIGYAMGMLVIVPLGDVVERRGLVLKTLLATTVVALLLAAAPNLLTLQLASFCLGFATCTPQLLVPFAAHLADPETRGKTVGFVMSGLLLGILLARTVSGFLGGFAGWRAVYVTAAAASLVLAVVLRKKLPESHPTGPRLAYRDLFRSLGTLIKEEPVLRESSLYGACLFGAFSAFWTTLAFVLSAPPLRLGPEAAGGFGLIGAAGALAAPIAGRLADKDGPQKTILIGLGLTLVSFAIMLPATIPALIVGVLLMDVGVQAAHISNQSRIYARRPESRNRMNTVYMTTYFIGGSVGSALGNLAWSKQGWPGVCLVGAALSLIALIGFGLYRRAPKLVE